ncbi:MAG: sodium:calcium antiporter [Longimicrobiales bacterium]|nr:sodium:calcium antiporter [Longimicrobiales bacterium]
MPFILLVGGVLGLWIGTQFAVSGAVRLSERFGLSEGFVGLAILALGTDLPEVVVAVGGSLQQLRGIDASGVIVGSALGSVIAQGSLVIGIAGLVTYLPVAPSMVRRDGTVLLLSVAAVAVVVWDGSVNSVEGTVLVLAWGIYLASLLLGERRRRPLDAEELEAIDAIKSRMPPLLEIALGLIIVTMSAHAVVTGAVSLAHTLGVTQTMLGVVLIGVGTSLPELALSLRAAIEKRASMSVGNVIGSNIFDLLIPVGLAAMIHPIRVEAETIFFDLPALLVLSGVLLFFLHRRRGVQRHEALTLVVLYGVYVVVRIGAGLP